YLFIDKPGKKSGKYTLVINEDQRKILEETQLNSKCSLQQLTIAALIIYFGKTTDQCEFVYGVPIHKRRTRHLRNIVGMFSGVLPFVGFYQEKIKINEFLKNIKFSQKA